MKYVNAAEVLPERLLRELQAYIDGEMLYIPKASSKKEWGTVSGSRIFYRERNREIRRLYQEGYSMEALAEQYGLAQSTIRKRPVRLCLKGRPPGDGRRLFLWKRGNFRYSYLGYLYMDYVSSTIYSQRD